MYFCYSNQPSHRYFQAAEILYNEWKDEFRIFDSIHTLRELETHLSQLKVFFAMVGEEVIGVATISKDDWGIRTDLAPWLANVCIKPQNRNQGIGTKLLHFVLSHVTETIYLWTYTIKLASFYETFGFTMIQHIKNHAYFENIYVMSYSSPK